MGAFVDGARAVSRDRVVGQAASRRWEKNNLTQGPTRHDLDAAGTGRGSQVLWRGATSGPGSATNRGKKRDDLLGALREVLGD